MMRRAGRIHGLRLIGLASVAAVLTAVGLNAWNRIVEAGQARAKVAHSLVQQLLKADTDQVPEVVQAIADYRHWTDPELRRVVEELWAQPKAKLHASLALLPVDPAQVAYLETRLFDAEPGEVSVLREALRSRQNYLTPKLWSLVDSVQPDDPRLVTSASALALYDPENPRWSELGTKVAQGFVRTNPAFFRSWLDALRPVRAKLTAPLAAIYRDRTRSDTEHTLATRTLEDFASDDPDLLADLLMDADPKAYAVLFPVVERQSPRTLPILEAKLEQASAPSETNPSGLEADKDRRAERGARAAIALIRMAKPERVWPLLRHSADPRLRSFLVNWLNPLGADPQAVAAELGRLESSPRPAGRGEGARRAGEGSSPPATAMDAILFHPETSIRRALILALGTYGTKGLSPGEREPLILKLLELYRHDPDAGIHGAAEWTLRQWEQSEKLETTDAELSRLKDRSGRRWTVNGQGQTFVLVEGPVEFRMGAPPNEPDRDAEDETPHRRVIPRRFAIAAKEVTVAQYQRFVREIHQFGIARSFLEKNSPEPNGPRISVTWFGAAAYCNWLSQQEGLPKDQWCYLPNAQGKFDKGMTIPADALQRTGYRLPTEAEWEYACRAGTATSRPYGLSINLLEFYARYQANSKDHAWRCGSLLPNDLGLFDMLGNVIEWCQERHALYQPGKAESSIDDIVDDHPRLLRGGSFIYRPAIVRSAYRDKYVPSAWSTYTGLRPARTDN
jgi:formylglycine-generating enzyme required for sulfatase activity